MEIIYFCQASGKQPVKQYIDALPTADAAAVLASLESLKRSGLKNTLVSLKPIAGKLWELKISAHRVFYVMVTGDVIVLLHAYKKQTQKAPKKEIDLAQKRMKLLLGGGGYHGKD
jgi:phage-related protein